MSYEYERTKSKVRHGLALKLGYYLAFGIEEPIAWTDDDTEVEPASFFHNTEGANLHPCRGLHIEDAISTFNRLLVENPEALYSQKTFKAEVVKTAKARDYKATSPKIGNYEGFRLF